METLTQVVFALTALIALGSVYVRFSVGVSLAGSVAVLAAIVGSLTMGVLHTAGYPGLAFIAIAAAYFVAAYAALYWMLTDRLLSLPLPGLDREQQREAKRQAMYRRVNNLPPAVAARALNIVVDRELRRRLEARLADYQTRQHIRAVA